MLFPTILLVIADVALAAPVTDLIMHEKRTPTNHLRRRRVDGDSILPVRIALSQSNLEKGYDHLMKISDPESDRYGRHWSTEEIHREFAPSTDTIDAVTAWLEGNDFHTNRIASATSKGWIGLDMPARDAERLFGTEYYEHRDSNGDVSVQCDEYHVPSHLSSHIDYVEPGIASSSPLHKAKASKRTQAPSSHLKARSSKMLPNISATDTSKCGEWITPACLKAMYGIPDAKYNQSENDLGIFAFFNAYEQRDLDTYWSHYAPWVPNGTYPKEVSINGAEGREPKAPSYYVVTESDIDFDLAFSLIYPQAVTLYQTSPNEYQQKSYIKEYGKNATALGGPSLWLPFISALDGSLCTEAERQSGADCGTINDLTRVLSVSYGASELQLPESIARRTCNEFMKLSLKGHTLLLSSGDFGVAQRPPGQNPASGLPIQNGCKCLKRRTYPE
jgi:tripeptidyl-peptidase-1